MWVLGLLLMAVGASAAWGAWGAAPTGGSAAAASGGAGRASGVLRAGIVRKESMAPLLYAREEGAPVGYAADYLGAVAEAMGVRLEWVQFADRQEVQRAMQRGEVDMVPVAVMVPEVIVSARVSEPFVTTRGMLYSGKPGAVVRAAADLRGERLVAVSGVGVEGWLSLQGLTATMVESTSAAVRMLLSGEADHLISPQMLGRATLAAAGAGQVRETALASVEGLAPLRRSFAFGISRMRAGGVSDVNRAMRQVRASGVADALHNRWLAVFEPRTDTVFGDLEVDLYDAAQPGGGREKLIVGVERCALMAGLLELPKGGEGEPIGLIPELARAVGERLGRPVRLQVLGSTELRDALHFGEVDFVAGAVIREADLLRMDYTRPILRMPGVVARRMGAAPADRESDLRGMSLAVVERSAAHRWVRSLGVERVMTAGTIEEALGAVRRGEVDGALEYEAPVRDAISRGGLSGLRVDQLPGTGFSRSYAFAVRAGDKATLWHVEDAVRGLEEAGEVERLTAKWMDGLMPRPRVVRLPGRVIFWTAAGLAAVGTMAVVWYAVLRMELRRRTLELRQERDRTQAMVDNLPCLAFGYRLFPDGRREVMYANKELANWRARFELLDVGVNMEQMEPIVHPQDREAMREKRSRCRREVTRFEHEVRLMDRQGVYHWVQFVLVPRTETGCTAWHGTLMDVSVLRDAVEALESSEKSYRAIFDGGLDPMVLVSTSTLEIVAMNAAAERVFGADVGRSFEGVAEWTEELRSVLSEAGRGRGVVARSLGYASLDGEERRVELSAQPVVYQRRSAVLVVVRDVTERERAAEQQQRLEAELAHAQRLESLGVMAGAIAHDFNNLLVGVMSNAGLAKRQFHDPAGLAESLDSIQRASEHAAGLTKQLQAFASPNRYQTGAVDVNQVCRELVSVLGSQLSARATVRYQLDERLPRVEGDGTQVRQVIMNLLTNAADAMPAGGGGITIRTRVVQLNPAEQPDCVIGGGNPAGRYVCVEIEDTGKGMDPATARRIFDPFFSTKATGRGLGLATVARVVQRHRAVLTLRSTMGKGTTFGLNFVPAATSAEPAAAAPALGGAEATPGKVLLIDDDVAVRGALTRMLEQAGWDVTPEEDGAAGLATLADASDFDCVLVDHTMPGMSGAEVLRHVRRLRPSLPVIVMSGYAPEDLADRDRGERPDGYLQKPFPPETVFDMLRRVRGAGRRCDGHGAGGGAVAASAEMRVQVTSGRLRARDEAR